MQQVKAESVEAIEKIEIAAPLPDDLPLPDSLSNLEPDELRRLERSLVRRLDYTLLPVVLLLFLLNIIDVRLRQLWKAPHPTTQSLTTSSAITSLVQRSWA